MREVNLVRRSDNSHAKNLHCTLVRFLRHFNRLVQRHVAHSDRSFLARVFQVMVAEEFPLGHRAFYRNFIFHRNDLRILAFANPVVEQVVFAIEVTHLATFVAESLQLAVQRLFTLCHCKGNDMFQIRHAIDRIQIN